MEKRKSWIVSWRNVLLLIFLFILSSPASYANKNNPAPEPLTLNDISYAKLMSSDLTVSWYQGEVWIGKKKYTTYTFSKWGLPKAVVSYGDLCYRDSESDDQNKRASLYGIKVNLPLVCDADDKKIKTTEAYIESITYKKNGKEVYIVNSNKRKILLAKDGAASTVTAENDDGYGYATVICNNSNVKSERANSYSKNVQLSRNAIIIMSTKFDDIINDSSIPNEIEIKINVSQKNYQKNDAVSQTFTYKVELPSALVSKPEIKNLKYNDSGNLSFDYSNVNAKNGSEKNNFNTVNVSLTTHDYENNFDMSFDFNVRKGENSPSTSAAVAKNCMSDKNSNTWTIDLPGYVANNWSGYYKGIIKNSAYKAVWDNAYKAKTGNEGQKKEAADKALKVYIIRKMYEGRTKVTVSNIVHYSNSYGNLEKPEAIKAEVSDNLNDNKAIAQPLNATAINSYNKPEITVKWSSLSGNSYDNSQTFTIERKVDDGAYSKYGNVKFVKTKKNYSFVDTSVEEGKTYSYRISRLPGSNNKRTDVSTIATVKVDYGIVKPSDINVAWDSEAGAVVFAFQYNKEKYNSLKPTPTFILERRLTGENKWEEVTYTTSENAPFALMDNNVETHTSYDYRLTTRMGENLEFVSSSVTVTTTYIQSEVTDFTASKGIYNDGVTLQFKLTRGTPTIYIERRVKGTDTYRQISQLDNLTPSNVRVVNYTDNSCSVDFYEYRLRMEDWNNEADNGKGAMISGYTNPEVGFKRSSGTVTGKVAYEGGVAVKDAMVSAIPASSKIASRNAVLISNKSTGEMCVSGNASNLKKDNTYVVDWFSSPFTIQLWAGTIYNADFAGTGFKELLGLGPVTVAVKNSGSKYQVKLYEFVEDGKGIYSGVMSESARREKIKPSSYNSGIGTLLLTGGMTDEQYEEMYKDEYHAGDRAFFQKEQLEERTDSIFYWDQITLTYDRNTLSCYVNGELIGTDTIPASQLKNMGSYLENISLLQKWHHSSIEFDLGLELAYTEYLASKGLTRNKEDEIPNDFYVSYYDKIDNRKIGIDEVRLWSKVLSAKEISQNYSSFLMGDEEGLQVYWKFDEQVEGEFYDYSFNKDIANERHGEIWGGGIGSAFSLDAPSTEQLGPRAYTDEYGNYTITGIPYASSGSSYRVIPSFGTHSFSPNEEVLHFDATSYVQNSIHFDDISSFTVTGQVFYEGTKLPVQGANVYVDDVMAIKNGEAVETSAAGIFNVEVPIGSHYLKVTKSGHTFTNKGRYPASADSLFVFDRNIEIPTYFYDETKCRVVGRICGGIVQGNKGLAQNLSKNNLGDLRFSIQVDAKEIYPLSSDGKPDTTIIYHPIQNVAMGPDGPLQQAGKHIFKTMMVAREITSGKYEYVVIPDEESGEYVIDLVPESFITTEVIAGSNSDGSQYEASEYQRPGIDVSNRAGVEAYITYETGDSAMTYNSSTGMSTKEAVSDSISYSGISQNFIRRNLPIISVSQSGMEDGLFGDTEITYYSAAQEDNVTIPFIANGKYLVNDMPVFTQGNGYTFDIALKEVYSYSKEGKDVVDVVPVTDGNLYITNGFDIDGFKELAVDTITGTVKYKFVGSAASLSINSSNPKMSFVNTMNITAVCNDGVTTASWYPESAPFKATHIGGCITGNNFVTKGPKNIITVLRDPPGSNSYSSVSNGSCTTTLTGKVDTHGEAIDFNFDVVVGAKLTTGQFLYTESLDNQNRAGVGLSQSATWTKGETVEQATSWNITYSTSDDPAYVGSQYDLILGQSTNIIYSDATTLRIYPENDLPAGIDVSKTIDLGNGYVFAQRIALDVSLDFETTFLYTVDAIETKMIPDLEKIRNTFILPKGTAVNKDLLTANAYVSKVDVADKNYGLSGNYTVYYPTNPDYITIDTVLAYNREIAAWKKVLADNEEDKIKSATANNNNLKNYSLSAGGSIEYSSSTSKNISTVDEYNWEASPHVQADLLLKVFGVGLDVGLQVTSLNSGVSYNDKDVANDTCFTYHLQDDDAYDYHSIDVYKSSRGWGPIFKMRGGQTSCPYEDKVLPKYYNSKTTISDGSAQVEVPKISVSPGIRTGVPGNTSAVFELSLSNESSVASDLDFILKVNEETNPDGANLSIDGEPIANGRYFTVSSGKKFIKTLTLSRTNENVKDYKEIELQFCSTCDASVLSTCKVSASFVASLGDISINSSIDNTVMNIDQMDAASTITGSYKGRLPIKVESYDYNKNDLYEIQILYKGSTEPETAWKQLARYMKKPSDDKTGKALQLESGSFTHYWDMQDVVDKTYNVKAVALTVVADQGPMSSSAVMTVIKNTKAPQVFGTPQPGSGVLNIGSDISIAFDKEIDRSKIDVDVLKDISVKGILNSEVVDHNCGLSFDGNAQYAIIPSNVNLSNTPFTVEFQAKRARMNTKEVILSQNADGYSFEVGYSADNRLYVTMNGKNAVSSEAVSEADAKSSFANYRLAYNGSKVWLVFNSKNVVSGMVVGDYNVNAPLYIGMKYNSTLFFKGQLHNLRVWKKYMLEGSNLATTLSGNEVNLSGYWPCDEASGRVAKDKVRGKNASLLCSWFVDPLGKGVVLNGSSRVSLPLAKQLTKDYCYSVELWFKAAKPAANATIIANSSNESQFNIFLDNKGQVNIASCGQTIVAAGNVADNTWHNVVWSVNPNSSATLFVDGEAKGYMNSALLEGVYGSEFSLGALPTFDPSKAATEYSGYFTGSIDEFRYWNITLDKARIAANYANKLHGDEGGLLSYYPFDKYNDEKTLLVDNPGDVVNSGKVLTFVGGGKFGDDAMALKAPLPLTSIPFTWALNTDKLIVNLPTSTYYKQAYENCNLTISVNRLFDLYGNKAQAYSWNVYVNRKEVCWSEDELSFSTTNEEPYTFTTDITNESGAVKEFAVVNLPSWLTVTPANGTLQPQSSKTLTFTVAAGINIGRYEQPLYLTDAINSNDVIYTDVMYVDFKVGAEAPNWSVNVNSYEFSMNVFGVLQIEGVPSIDSEDLVGAFDGEQCIGVASPQYVEAYNRFFLFMKVYSNSPTIDDLRFRIWDASKGLVYAAKTSEKIVFSDREVYGSAGNPVIFDTDAEKYQTILLNKGWNWISFNVYNSNFSSVDSVLGGLTSGDGDIVKYSQTDYFDTYSPNTKPNWSGTLSQNGGGFNNEIMYMLRTTYGGELNVRGIGVDPTQTPITVKSGAWNYISYLPSANMTVEEALAGYDAQQNDVLKSIDGFALYDAQIGWIGDIDYMKPGSGYIVYRTSGADTKFYYPESGSSLSSIKKRSRTNTESEYYRYSGNMSIVAQVKNYELAEGDALAAYVDGELVATANLITVNDNDYYYLTIPGENDFDKNISFGIVREGSLQATSRNRTGFNYNGIRGNLTKPYLVNFGDESDIYIEATPNPFTEKVEVTILTDGSAASEVRVFDVSGRLITILKAEKVDDNCYTAVWNGTTQQGTICKQGIYLLSVITDEGVETLKVEKK